MCAACTSECDIFLVTLFILLGRHFRVYMYLYTSIYITTHLRSLLLQNCPLCNNLLSLEFLSNHTANFSTLLVHNWNTSVRALVRCGHVLAHSTIYSGSLCEVQIYNEPQVSSTAITFRDYMRFPASLVHSPPQ